jgi:hypothetical protein
MATAEPLRAIATLTTPQLARDLKEIDQLIATLRRSCNIDAEDLDDLSWLQGRRRYVLTVLAARRAQRGKQVVSLDLWRNGGVPMPAPTSRAA